MRSIARRKPAEPALAPAIFGDRVFKRGAIEIRPMHGQKHEFAISRLPQQKIRQTLLAAGADDQIRIRQVGGVEEIADASQR